MAEDLRPALTALLPKLRRFGIALTGSAAEADDLVQDVCARALQHAAHLRDRARLDAWLYGIMRNRWIDEQRARARHRHDALEAADDVAGEDGMVVTEGRITLALVRHRLQQLSAEQRAVLILVCVDGLSYRETAEVLGVAIGTVMSRLARGRRALAERLADRPAGSVSPFPLVNGRGPARPP